MPRKSQPQSRLQQLVRLEYVGRMGQLHRRRRLQAWRCAANPGLRQLRQPEPQLRHCLLHLERVGRVHWPRRVRTDGNRHHFAVLLRSRQQLLVPDRRVGAWKPHLRQ